MPIAVSWIAVIFFSVLTRSSGSVVLKCLTLLGSMQTKSTVSPTKSANSWVWPENTISLTFGYLMIGNNIEIKSLPQILIF